MSGRSAIRTARRGDLTIFHYALPSPMTAAFASLDRGRVLQYHNVTPARVLRAVRCRPLPPGDARPRRSSRRWRDAWIWRSATRNTTGRSSRRSASRRTGVFPIAVDTARVTQPARRPALEAILDDGLVNFLFVGRIAPNKKIEDHIRLAEHYKRYVDAYYRFIFVGRFDVVPRYYSMIRALMARLPVAATIASSSPARFRTRSSPLLPARRRLHLAQRTRGILRAAARSHGGRRPVLAYAAAAVPDTLGGAGVQFAPKDLEYAAELLGALAFDDDLRAAVIAGPAPAPGGFRRRADLARARRRFIHQAS